MRKRETERLIFSTKEQAIRTNIIKGKIDKEQTKCRICSRNNKTVNHILSECPRHAQKECKRRHDWIGRRTNLEIYGVNGIHGKSKYCEHQTEVVIENDFCKILWDFTVKTDHLITARRPRMVFIDKEHQKYQTIDFIILCCRC